MSSLQAVSKTGNYTCPYTSSCSFYAQALLITKDPTKAQAIHAALPVARYEVKMAASPAECLSLLNSRTKYLPDVVLLVGVATA
jgi:PleD family two-component response regulator